MLAIISVISATIVVLASFGRLAINENTTGDQNYSVMQRNGVIRRVHRHTPKTVEWHSKKHFKNC